MLEDLLLEGLDFASVLADSERAIQAHVSSLDLPPEEECFDYERISRSIAMAHDVSAIPEAPLRWDANKTAFSISRQAWTIGMDKSWAHELVLLPPPPPTLMYGCADGAAANDELMLEDLMRDNSGAETLTLLVVHREARMRRGMAPDAPLTRRDLDSCKGEIRGMVLSIMVRQAEEHRSVLARKDTETESDLGEVWGRLAEMSRESAFTPWIPVSVLCLALGGYAAYAFGLQYHAVVVLGLVVFVVACRFAYTKCRRHRQEMLTRPLRQLEAGQLVKHFAGEKSRGSYLTFRWPVVGRPKPGNSGRKPSLPRVLEKGFSGMTTPSLRRLSLSLSL